MLLRARQAYLRLGSACRKRTAGQYQPQLLGYRFPYYSNTAEKVSIIHCDRVQAYTELALAGEVQRMKRVGVEQRFIISAPEAIPSFLFVRIIEHGAHLCRCAPYPV